MDSKKGSSQTQPNPTTQTNTSSTSQIEQLLLDVLTKLNSSVQSGRVLSENAKRAIQRYRAISAVLRVSPLKDRRPGVGA